MKVILRIATSCLMALLLSSCASNTGGTGSTAPTITLTDFRAQNIERVRDGVLSLMGEDSAGLAGKEYIRAFEEDLAMRIPTQGAMPAPVNSDPVIDNEDISIGRSVLERYRVGEYRTINNIPLDPKLLELKRYLDGRKVEAIGELRRRNEAFKTHGDIVSAKMGLAASYVVISCANEPGDVETITKLVEPLLTELTKK